ncbi:MAG: hypothetical protein LKE46_00725 [Clostridium sp.]|jgi:hypothetical protein|uniref:hypothetical protein n=1 Tax=Clostridium sp. TaxID=1506 RepID=UPI0025BC7CDA|nr:hypothetical protein [Clostridium sp.]MCH3962778.1 hypothetical protein [Clostridium sp.]MCI1715807.1 hypothetical protein [Clostridium sp.]MCI1799988.1 hypothetical protein [Clostridium sp.]MCI1813902.1 hypothetical protein [Clostridium sp.]MCI1870800.1 hypothetical protein [Clostridium sp.]
MSKHHHRNNVNSGFNLGDILKNIDITQLLSMLSSFSGSRGMMSNDKISSMLDNLNMGDLGETGLDDSDIKSKLGALEKRLSSLENRNQMQNEVLQKVRELQNSPDAAKFLNDFMSSNSDGHKRHR